MSDHIIVPRRDLYPDGVEETPLGGQSGQRGAQSSTADRTTWQRPTAQQLSGDLRPETWFTLEQAAQICHRKRGTMVNMIGRYQLPRRLGWRVTNGHRRRAVLLSPAVVAWLQQRTLLAPIRDRRAERQAQEGQRPR